MENRLSDVHSIAGELLRRGEIGNTASEAEASRIVRVERQPPQRGPAIMPTAVPFGLDDELRKLGTQLEAIRRSVEFTEAHVAVNGALPAAASEAETEMTPPSARTWPVPLLLATNLVLGGLLIAEINGGWTSRIALDLYRTAVTLTVG